MCNNERKPMNIIEKMLPITLGLVVFLFFSYYSSAKDYNTPSSYSNSVDRKPTPVIGDYLKNDKINIKTLVYKEEIKIDSGL